MAFLPVQQDTHVDLRWLCGAGIIDILLDIYLFNQFALFACLRCHQVHSNDLPCILPDFFNGFCNLYTATLSASTGVNLCFDYKSVSASSTLKKLGSLNGLFLGMGKSAFGNCNTVLL